MLRKTGVVAASAAMFVALLGGTSYADEPVDTVNRTLKTAVGGHALPGGIDTGGGVRPPAGNSSVVGAIDITWQEIVVVNGGGPTYTLYGALADANQWSCGEGPATATSYSVVCTPQTLPVNVSYTCQVLHADIMGFAVTSAGRTTMDCNGDGVPEAQTDTISGTGFDNTWAVSTMPVTTFTCIVDLVVPSISARCGDPGIVTVE